MKRVLYLQYTDPTYYPPLEHSAQILAEHGWKVVFLGTEVSNGLRLEFSPAANASLKRMNHCRPGVLQKIHYFIYVCWTFSWTLFWRPKLVYVSDPLACPAALAVSFLPGVRLIYHEHDGVPEEPKSLFMTFCLKARAHVAKRALLCILPNQQRLTHFQHKTQVELSKLFCVWNCPSLREVRPKRDRAKDARCRLYYHGSIGADLISDALVKTLVKFENKIHLTAVGYETAASKGLIANLSQLAKDCGADQALTFHSALPRHRLWDLASAADVGVAFVSSDAANSNMRCMTGASNKFFDYLASGLAVLVSDLPDWQKCCVEPGYGIACDPKDPESLEKALRWFLEHPQESQAMGERGRQRILEEWNYEKQFEKVMEKIKCMPA